MSAYSELLKDPRWQKKRLEIFNRDNFTCRICGAKRHTLHVHHLSYADSGYPWDGDDADKWTVCEFCHSAAHCRTKIRSLIDGFFAELPEKECHLQAKIFEYNFKRIAQNLLSSYPNDRDQKAPAEQCNKVTEAAPLNIGTAGHG